MKKTIIALGLTSLIALCGSVAMESQPAFALQENKSRLGRSNIVLKARTPSVVTQGFDALKVNDIEKAFTIWTNYSLPIIKDSASILTSTMPSLIDKSAGKCIGYTIIDTLSLSPNTKIVYAESQHESGALFWRLTVHQTPTKPVITSIDFNTDPSQLIPMNVEGFLYR
ncbi:MAG: hypothetical protein AAGE96_03460 [Cyanobacteria bacterium P01_G01_bin.19]